MVILDTPKKVIIKKMVQGGQTTDDEKVPFIEITKANVADYVK